MTHYWRYVAVTTTQNSTVSEWVSEWVGGMVEISFIGDHVRSRRPRTTQRRLLASHASHCRRPTEKIDRRTNWFVRGARETEKERRVREQIIMWAREASRVVSWRTMLAVQQTGCFYRRASERVSEGPRPQRGRQRSACRLPQFKHSYDRHASVDVRLNIPHCPYCCLRPYFSFQDDARTCCCRRSSPMKLL